MTSVTVTFSLHFVLITVTGFILFEIKILTDSLDEEPWQVWPVRAVNY